MLQVVSAIGPVEQVRRGWLVEPTFSPEYGEWMLAATGRCGKGQTRLLPCWTELFRENRALAKRALLRAGAQVSIRNLSLVA